MRTEIASQNNFHLLRRHSATNCLTPFSSSSCQHCDNILFLFIYSLTSLNIFLDNF